MQVGDFFDGRYQIMGILGRGGMSTVYSAKNIHTDTLWAIKEISGNENAGIDLLAEPKLLKKLEHPALPRLYDILEQNGNLYMVSDYIDGLSLDKKLERDGRCPEKTVTDWGIQLCEALDYLHSQEPNPIIYRDMKPSNIILTGNGTLKLIDFGIAREYKLQSEGDTVFIGTRGYAAPEQYGLGQTTAASDIYSLGVTMHHLLTGKSPLEPPYGIKPIRQLNDALSPEIEAIVKKCTCDIASERYQSAAVLKKDLEDLKNLQDQKTRQDQQIQREQLSYQDQQARQSRLNGQNQRNRQNGQNESINGLLDQSINSTYEAGKRKYGFTGGDEAGSRRQAAFRKLVITVWGNAEFGCELAYMAAKHVKSEVLLADLDLIAPKADLYLNLERHPSDDYPFESCGYSGLDSIIHAIERGALDNGLIRQAATGRRDLKNLFVLTGNYRLENYPFYKESCISRLIERCYRCFDIVILLVNRSVYDLFTVEALQESDVNIAAVRSEVDQFREFNSYLEYLKKKRNLSEQKTRFVLYEYDKVCSLSLNDMGEETRDNIIGKIPFSKRRLLHRNLNGAYSTRMEKDIEQEYGNILVKLGLLSGKDRMQGTRKSNGRFFGSGSKDLAPMMGK